MPNFPDWIDNGYSDYDPQYFYEDDNQDDNKPVGPDDWARNGDDFEGGI